MKMPAKYLGNKIQKKRFSIRNKINFYEISRLQGLQNIGFVIQDRIFHPHVSTEGVHLSKIWRWSW